MDTFQAVKESVSEVATVDYPVPNTLNEIVSVFGRTHIYYRAYKHYHIEKKAFEDQAKGHPAVYGAALQLTADFTTIGSYAINLAVATFLAQRLLKEYRSLSESYESLQDAVRWQYPVYTPIKVEEKSSSFLSPSLQAFWDIQVMGMIQQILKITRCALDVLWQAFKLSMTMQDAYLLLNDDPQARFDACTELVSEWDEFILQMEEDGERLLEEIEKGQGLADRILTKLGKENSYVIVIDTLKTQMEKLAKQAKGAIKDAKDAGEETLDAVVIKGKITAFNINLAEGKLAPPTLPPARYPPWGGEKIELAGIPANPLVIDANVSSIGLPTIHSSAIPIAVAS